MLNFIRLAAATALMFILAVAFTQAQPSIDLGKSITENGIKLLQPSDGATAPAELGGRACQQVAPGSWFFYFDVTGDFKPAGDLFVTIDYFDQDGEITLQYDTGKPGPYFTSGNSYMQTGSQQWKKATFLLRGAKFEGNQHLGADFRIQHGGHLALSRVELSETPPDGFELPINPADYFAQNPPTVFPEGMTIIQQWQVHEPVSPAMLQDSPYEICKKVGITSLQSYVGWRQLEPEKGQVTYETYDPVVAQIRKHDLKWLPFIITAPWKATPVWFYENQGVDSVCLEHNQPIRIQSIWNPNLRDGVTRFLELFAAHYEADVIEALNFGISGNWGESIYVAGGGFDMEGVHTHMGWWCGDEPARADLRASMQEKFGTIEALNEAWATQYASFDQLEPFIPTNDPPSRRAAVDFANWYTGAMTDYAEHWVRTARELYPDLPIYLCTGGYGEVMLGADFAAQARMCAKYGAGIRITNQSDDGLMNFAVTRMVSSACRLYGQYYTTEPGGANSPKGIAERVLDAVSGGARGAYFKWLINEPDQPREQAMLLSQYSSLMIPNTPDLPVAALMPNASIALDGKVLRDFLDDAARLRDALDYEYIDENMIGDGLLGHFKAVVLLKGDTLEQSTLEALDKWINEGGILIAPADLLPLKNVEGQDYAMGQSPAADLAGRALFMIKHDKVKEALAMITAARGKGYVMTSPAKGKDYLELASLALHADADQSPWGFRIAEPLDGQFDNVIACRAKDSVYYCNNSDAPISKALANGETVSIEPRSLISVALPRP